MPLSFMLQVQLQVQLQIRMKLTVLTLLLKIMLLIIVIIRAIMLFVISYYLCVVGGRAESVDNETNEKPPSLNREETLGAVPDTSGQYL